MLLQVRRIMSKYPEYRLEISGHTDNTGDEGLNQRLSESRAKACYDYLVTEGISIRRLSFVGFGETKPIADNETRSGSDRPEAHPTLLGRPAKLRRRFPNVRSCELFT